jgi:tRNA dimethylallyltransferase
MNAPTDRPTRRIPVLVIAGPTACGKTAAAIHVARACGGEIISADSMQIYRELSIGTARPSPHERAQARFHLVGCVSILQPYTVADFQRDARALIAQAWGRGSLPILCGGTGLYIRAVLQGFAFAPDDPERKLQVRVALEKEAETQGAEGMHRRLAALDPVAAARIEPRNLRRVLRALEVLELTGEPTSVRPRVDQPPGVQYNPIIFVLNRPRDALYRAIDARVEQMMVAGWLGEVRAVRASLRNRHPSDLQALQAIGYRHLMTWLEMGEPADNLAEVIATIKRDTRRYAKRQLTWFRREPQATWLQWSDAQEFRVQISEMCRAAQSLVEGEGVAPECV